MSYDLILTIIAICVVIITGIIIYIAYVFVTSLKKLRTTLDLIEDTANDINLIKNGIKSGILSFVSLLIDRIQKGGEA